MRCGAAPLSCPALRRRPSPAPLEGGHTATLTAIEALGVAADEDLIAGVTGATPLTQGSAVRMGLETGHGERGAVGGGVANREPCAAPRQGTDAPACVHGHGGSCGPLHPSVQRGSSDARDHAVSPVTAGMLPLERVLPGSPGSLTTSSRPPPGLSRRSPVRRRRDATRRAPAPLCRERSRPASDHAAPGGAPPRWRPWLLCGRRPVPKARR